MSELNAKMYFRVAFLALLLPFVSGDCVNLDLGMESGSIPDNDITASTVQSASTPAKNGRLNYASGSSWCAGTNDSDPYLQIELQTLHIICAVSTQGNSQADQWVKTYKLQLSTNGSTWTDYKEGGQVKLLTGNENRSSEVKNILYEGVFARYLRFLPESQQGAVCLRTELFGVKLKPENLALGKTTAQSSTFSDALIGNAVSGRAVDGNPDTNMNNKHCSQTNTDNPSWWRVDLGSNRVPVSEIYIVNRFSPGDPTETSKDYEITLGSSTVVAANTKCKGRYSFIKFKASAVCFTNPLTTGRYVFIRTTKSQALQLCEVEIYSRENVAFNKQTSQSSTLTSHNAVSGRGVDGNSATSFGAGSCTHTDLGDDKPWWRVDLGKVERVTEVYIVNRAAFGVRLSNFEIRVGTISANGGVTNPKCGSTYSVPQGEGLSFFCHPSLYGRYVTIGSLLNDRLTLCEVEVYSERRACPMQSIGVASKDAFLDSSFSASSTRSGNEAFKGRLYGDGAWSPSDNNNASDYLQIDLLYEFVICAVATQGNPSANDWTKTYKLQLSYDGSNWVIYQENSIDKVFNGNSEQNDTVKHSLKEYASARFIRFQPTTYFTHKALRVEVFGVLVSSVPSQAPSGFTVVASTSTSITASWQLPPDYARHGNITGFKLFYKEKDSAGSLPVLTNNAATLTRVVSMLDKYTEYEFQVLAFTSEGDGPKSSVLVERTKEDAPDVPASFNHTNIAPDKSRGPKVNLIWSEPIKANGIIRSYNLFYGHEKDTRKETFGKDTLSYSVDVLGGLTYQFSVRAVTIKPGENVTLTVNVPEYEPSFGPDNVVFSELNKTTFNISWAPLTREKSHGKVILYDVKEELVSTGKRRKRSISSRTLNTTTTFVVLHDLSRCTQYHVSVRAYTKAGSGPYSQPMVLQTSRPEPPQDLKEKHFGTTEVTLEWTEPNIAIEGASYTVKYSGTKSYNESFMDDGLKEAIKSTTYTVKNLVPGSQYDFEVYATSVCGESSSAYVKVETTMEAPIAPVVVNFADVTVTESVAGINLWPVEQRNGPISAYQVIVLKVVDGAKELPDDYDSKLEDTNNANEENLNFYIAAEIENDPVYEESWKFTVGDDLTHGSFVNKPLERGQEYVIFQRALTHDNEHILKGEVGKVARIVFPQDVGGQEESEDSESLNPAAVAVPVVLLLLILAALIVVVWYWRKKHPQRKNKRNRTHGQLDDIPRGSVDTTTSSVSPVYQNMVDIGQHHRDVVEVTPPEENEVVYSEADDGKPKPIPVAEFAKYVRTKSSNGAIVLREEFKNLPGGLQSPWEVGKNNRAKNRYGNITSYDHSRVVLEKIEGDPNSDYINASYMPTFDEETMCYIATQGPTQETLNDFWRMIWQENCYTIVMLTNLVEMGKKKCDQYWPDSTIKYGSIRVTLQKTENLADYIVRTFALVKDSEKRDVHQFHYVTWPDKGVPERSTALLGFRWKVHARHQATGGPLVVHCSAGVGRTGTYIGIDAMLEGAEVKKSVFIQNYVQVMRGCRPYMVQKEEQYVFLHQAVMEALTCGNTEIAPQDLRIVMGKLARAQKSSQRTGFAQEFKRLELVSNYQSSEKESKEGFKPSSINKNRFPNIVPLDSSRVFLSSSDPEKNYINASFADGYKQRGAYILTQAPLDNTVEDFWCMISQYEIGTIVMLNSLKEGKESYPQYWPAEESAQYGSITLQMLSENTSNNITTRKFTVSSEKPRKQSAVQHLHFTGWSNPDSCPDPKEILDLLTAIQQSQQQTGNGIIVFQCSDGVGRSGCVSSIMSVIDRVKTEQTVDVFQTVKLIRARRPGAVDTLDRYEFCYKTIQAYLDSFSTYANFAEC